jgi:hypothetical protein
MQSSEGAGDSPLHTGKPARRTTPLGITAARATPATGCPLGPAPGSVPPQGMPSVDQPATSEYDVRRCSRPRSDHLPKSSELLQFAFSSLTLIGTLAYASGSILVSRLEGEATRQELFLARSVGIGNA